MLNFVIVTEEDGKYKALPIQKRENENLVSVMEIPNVHIMQYVASKKRAIEVAECWNDSYTCQIKPSKKKIV